MVLSGIAACLMVISSGVPWRRSLSLDGQATGVTVTILVHKLLLLLHLFQVGQNN